MSEDNDHILPPDHQGYSGAPGRPMTELSPDQQLVIAAQRGISDMVRDLLHQGAQLGIDQVRSLELMRENLGLRQ